jgi:hypothetical protein
VISAREPAERSSDAKLEVIQEFATRRWSEAPAAGSASVVRAHETLEKPGQTYCHPLHAFVLRLGSPAKTTKMSL